MRPALHPASDAAPSLTAPAVRPEGGFEPVPTGLPAEDAGWISLHPWASFGLLTAVYFVAVACLSSVKVLWLDELITVYIARLGSVHAIWQALARGADPNPPLVHISVMLCRKIFGEHAFVLRLPAALGYWLGMLSLFAFLKRRLPAIWALTGTLLSMSMGGFEWSYECRSYAIFYGLAMAALLCWTVHTDAPHRSRRRAAALAGMTLALAAGLCTNYFATLAFFPIAAAELTRTGQAVYERRRRPEARAPFDWPVWFCLAVAATPLLAFRHQIATSIALYQPYAWNKVSPESVVIGYMDMVAQIVWAILILIALTVLIATLANLRPSAQDEIRPRSLARFASASWFPRTAGPLTWAEASAVAVLVAYPYLGYAVASLRGGMLSARFVIPVCFGVAIVGTLLAYRLFAPFRWGAGAMLTLFVLWFGLREAWVGFHYQVQKESFFRLLNTIPPPEYPGQPLVVSDNLLILPLQYYAPPALKSRIVYPIDFPEIMRDRGEASGEVNLWAGRNSVYDFNIEPLATLQASTSTYIILTSGREWLVGDLLNHHYEVTPLLDLDAHSSNLEYWATPVTHARPVFFRAYGDLGPETDPPPVPFNADENVK